MQSIAADYPYSHDGAPEMQRAYREYYTTFLQKNQVLFLILQKYFRLFCLFLILRNA